MRISSIFHLALAFFFGAILFWTSQSVQDKERHIYEARNMLAQEQETIRVLSTEWDYLNSPIRLEKLAKQGVGMDETANENGIGIVSKVGEIPEPIAPIVPTIKPASLVRIEPAAGVSSQTLTVPSTVDKQRFNDVVNSLIADTEGER